MLEAQFSVLLSKISSTHDFEHIRLAHDKFIATLQAQLLLANNAVSPSPFGVPTHPTHILVYSGSKKGNREEESGQPKSSEYKRGA